MMKATLLLATLTCVPVLAVPVAMQPTKMPVHEKGAVSLIKQEATYGAPLCFDPSDSTKLLFPKTMGGTKTTMLGGQSVSPEAWCNYPNGWGNGAPTEATCATQVVFKPSCMSSITQGQEAQLSCATWASMADSTEFFAYDCAWNATLGKCKASSEVYTCYKQFADALTTKPSASTNAVALHAVAKPEEPKPMPMQKPQHTPSNREKGAVSLAKQVNGGTVYIPTCSSTSDSSKLIFPSYTGLSNKTTMLGGQSVSPEAWCNSPNGWGNGAPSKEDCAKQIVFDPPCMSSITQGQEAQLSCSTWASMSTSTEFFAYDCAWNDELQKCKASSDKYKCPMAFADTLTTKP